MMHLELRYHDRPPTEHVCERLTVRVGGFEVEVTEMDDGRGPGLYVRVDGLLQQLVVLPYSSNGIGLVSR